MLMKNFVVAIDGPAGAGKSSLASELSKRLDIQYLDTGGLFRAVAYNFLCMGVVPEFDAITGQYGKYTEEAIAKIEKELPNIRLESKFIISNNNPFLIGALPDPHIFLNGADVEVVIHSPEISRLTSRISQLPAVREFILNFEHEYADKYAVVMEGRDISTVVFPDAPCKIFITANPEVRAARRLKELLPENPDITLDEVLKDINERDKADSERENAPLLTEEIARATRGYSVLNTSTYTLGQSAHILEVMARAYLSDFNKAKERELLELQALANKPPEPKVEETDGENGENGENADGEPITEGETVNSDVTEETAK
ncbi:MAG: (d)CMP kinase [Oscillospiraceae bacterium]|jgi:cytidylate kinase|nr:(d)CMP kinase [Oscillospiraceae bacterium]